MFGAFNTFGKLGSLAGGRSLLAQIQAMGASFIGIPSLSNYQDSAGTTLVTQPGGGSADPPVGKVLDLSGLGNQATQSTSPARPKLSARKNLLTYTEDFSNGVWVPSNATVSADVALSPLGVLNADSLSDTAVTNTHYIGMAVFSLSGSYQNSIYAKAGSKSRIMLYSYLIGRGIGFDLTNGTTFAVDTISSAGLTYDISPQGNGWYRCSILASGVNPSTPPFGVYMVLGTSFYYLGNGDNVYVWGAQMETGTVATPYQRVTDASNYDYSGFPLIHQFDGVDDAHVITFGSSLGSDCTVVTANRGTTPTIATAQTIGTSHTISATHAGKLIFNRALTAGETAIVTAWATKQGAIA